MCRFCLYWNDLRTSISAPLSVPLWFEFNLIYAHYTSYPTKWMNNWWKRRRAKKGRKKRKQTPNKKILSVVRAINRWSLVPFARFRCHFVHCFRCSGQRSSSSIQSQPIVRTRCAALCALPSERQIYRDERLNAMDISHHKIHFENNNQQQRPKKSWRTIEMNTGTSEQLKRRYPENDERWWVWIYESK